MEAEALTISGTGHEERLDLDKLARNQRNQV